MPILCCVCWCVHLPVSVRQRVCLPVCFGWRMVSGSIACPHKIVVPIRLSTRGLWASSYAVVMSKRQSGARCCEAARFGVLLYRTINTKVITLKIIAQKVITAKIITAEPLLFRGDAVALIRVNCVHKKTGPVARAG